MIEKWIIPCNVKHFDIIEHFKNNETVVWKNSFTIHKGDIAYIYLGAPFGEIRYRCSVISDMVDEQTLQENRYAIQEKNSNNYFSKKIKYIQLKLDYEYPAGFFPLAKLKENGLGQVQIQARPDRNLKRYLEDMEHKLMEGDDTYGE
jgi:5-methylcytosine-specific restriction protein A